MVWQFQLVHGAFRPGADDLVLPIKMRHEFCNTAVFCLHVIAPTVKGIKHNIVTLLELVVGCSALVGLYGLVKFGNNEIVVCFCTVEFQLS